MSTLEITLKGKTVLVTGAANGIGLELCKVLHAQGAKVLALDVNKEALSRLSSTDLCPGVRTLCVDLLDWHETRSALETFLESEERLDCLVNNAGIGIEGSFLAMDPSAFDKVVGVNLKAIVNVSQVAAQKMMDGGRGGSIVNMSSLASRFPTRASVAYNVSKAGVDMLTKSMALELGPQGIRVNSLNPNIVMTDLARQWMAAGDGLALKENLIKRTPLGRILSIPDVVHSILFLMSDVAPMIHGESLFIDGGYSAS